MDLEEKLKKMKRQPYEYADIAYRYVSLHNAREKIVKDFGTGEPYTTLEVHTVSKIEDNPGITVTEIAMETNRTKGAVSQIITKLEHKGLIRRERHPENPRRTSLYVTPEGLKLSLAHKAFDKISMGKVLDRLISLYGYTYVEKYFEIMDDLCEQLASSEEPME